MIRKRWALHRRDFPRRKTTDPYKIWISESMLAQTQTSRVVNYYNERMRLFPTVEDLARANKSDVLKARSGLGYNSRAMRLLQAANEITNYKIEKKSDFPDTYEDLIELPGVGDYTACAILAFAYNQDVAVVDTNIRRILIYHAGLDERAPLKDLKAKACEILPR